ncbi:hypothetical protein BBO99_00003111 [Phytophthora kernoviae]|uniref:Uncharacterized protein n=2 Tax=Phytophthora kernoviae TaxID=325452 RepID=A0A3R7J9L0_9STRA|nr:hypothetical protein G195_003246 [Phytophthora kernoviae 00238/432]KAG2528932.1 hypothetical protein JM16_000955 [Phytophthora kernoviae]KAG2530256.1 hypothetical protein JM18_001036 [Phytophthora kernoviae]RLN44220.1 hypothetical protein BBI17_002976 [Phytophthora kernoviae]RLN82149.1 hypothetical protein BBO99_00003111 [Phytophthora kernoviae]
MDEELAVKLQREEQEQWEHEMEGRFGGDDRQTGWCFVEVPSSSSGHGVMSVIQQEVTVEDQQDDDPDYTFALELQAQEAEEYDRMRRQEASSMERIRVIQQEDPKREEIRQTLQQYYDKEAHRELDPIAKEVSDAHRQDVEVPMARSFAAVVGSSKPTAVERPQLRDPDVYHDVYVDGAEYRVARKQFNSLHSALKHSDRKARHRNKASSSSVPIGDCLQVLAMIATKRLGRVVQ